MVIVACFAIVAITVYAIVCALNAHDEKMRMTEREQNEMKDRLRDSYGE
jgi:hypothetical protein